MELFLTRAYSVFNASEPFINLPYTVAVNGKQLEPWVIP